MSPHVHTLIYQSVHSLVLLTILPVSDDSHSPFGSLLTPETFFDNTGCYTWPIQHLFILNIFQHYGIGRKPHCGMQISHSFFLGCLLIHIVDYIFGAGQSISRVYVLSLSTFYLMVTRHKPLLSHHPCRNTYLSLLLQYGRPCVIWMKNVVYPASDSLQTLIK